MLAKGETYELDDDYATRLVKAGIAESAEANVKVSVKVKDDDSEKMTAKKSRKPDKAKAEKQDAEVSKKV